MKLVLFTSTYPFKPGEEFLHDEISHIYKYFEEITIVTSQKSHKYKEQYSTPTNVKIVILNRYNSFFTSIFYGFAKLFSIESIKEIYYAVNELGYVFDFKMLKILFIYYSVYKRNSVWIKKNVTRENKNLIIYSYWLSSAAYTIARFKKKGYKFTAISRAHGGDVFFNRGYQSFRKTIFEYLDEIHFVSEAGLSQFKNKMCNVTSSDSAKLYLSRLGTKRLISKSIMEYSIEDSDTLNIVTCSSIIPLKRLDLIIDALAQLDEIKITWVHFGDGYLKNEIKEMIKEKFDKKNIDIQFFGQIDNYNIHKFYIENKVDLFINMSDYEGVPVSIMEAISYGLPVIARNVGGNAEVVFHGRNGILLPEKVEAYEVARAIRDFVSLPTDVINEYKKQSINIWNKYYNAENNYQKFGKRLLKNAHES